MTTSSVHHLARRFLETAASSVAAAASSAAAEESEPSNSDDSSGLLSSSLLSSSSTPLDLFSTTNTETSNMTTSFLNDTVAMVLNNNDGDGDNATTTTFDPKVFWSVNAFILALFLTTVCCCCFGKKEWLNWFVYDHETGRESSDMQYRQSVLRRRQRQQQSKVETPAQRTKRLLRSFRRHQVEMTVTDDDIVDDDEVHLPDVELGNGGGAAPAARGENNSDNDDDSMQETGRLRLKNGSLVPNCCAICLMSYDVGDKVIWSSNPNCAHAFHEDCVVGWLVKMQPETPCPCCRQEFTDLETLRKERKIKWGPDHAFNPGLVSFSPPTGTTIEQSSSESTSNNPQQQQQQQQQQNNSVDNGIRTDGSSSTGETNEETV